MAVSDAMLTEVRHNVLAALNVSKDGRIELAEFSRYVPTFSYLVTSAVSVTYLLTIRLCIDTNNTWGLMGALQGGTGGPWLGAFGPTMACNCKLMFILRTTDD